MTTTAATLKGEARKAAAAVDCHAAEAAARAAREEAGNTPERAKAAPLFFRAAALFRRAVASYAGRGPRRAMLDAAAAMEEAGERAAAQAAAQSKEDKAAAQAFTQPGRAACRALLPLFPFYTLKAAADFARGLGVTIRREEGDGFTTAAARALEVFPRGQGNRAAYAETPAEAAFLAAVFALDESRNVFAFSGPSLHGRAEVLAAAALKAAGIEGAAVDSVEITPGPAPVAEVKLTTADGEHAARFVEYARNVPALCHAAQEAAAELAAKAAEEGPDGGPEGPQGPGPVERPGLAAEAAKGAATRYAAAQAATAKGAAKAAAEAARKAAKAAEAGDVDSLIDHAADAARAARFAATAADNAAEAARQAGNATAARYHATAAAFHRQAADAAAEAAEEEAAALDFARACPGPLFFELDAADAPRARFAIAL